jgi:hypothetical protein
MINVICCSNKPALSNIDGTYDSATLAQNSRPHTIDVTSAKRIVEYVLGFMFEFETVIFRWKVFFCVWFWLTIVEKNQYIAYQNITVNQYGDSYLFVLSVYDLNSMGLIII